MNDQGRVLDRSVLIDCVGNLHTLVCDFQIVYPYFSQLLRDGFSTLLLDLTISVSIFYIPFLIRRFYNTFIDFFRNFRGFKHINSFLLTGSKSKPCTYACVIHTFGIMLKIFHLDLYQQYYHLTLLM